MHNSALDVTPKELLWMHDGDFEVTQKERLSDFDDDEASIIPVVLGKDESFLDKAASIAAADPGDRAAVAQREAKKYAPYRATPGFHRRTSADRERKSRGCVGATRIRTPSLPTCFADLVSGAMPRFEETDGRRVRGRWKTLERGAQRLARFGEAGCIGCGKRLTASRCQARPRVTHCAACVSKYSQILDTHRSEIREALDAATGQRRSRRAARRASS
jgi:hypothetical protein